MDLYKKKYGSIQCRQKNAEDTDVDADTDARVTTTALPELTSRRAKNNTVKYPATILSYISCFLILPILYYHCLLLIVSNHAKCL